MLFDSDDINLQNKKNELFDAIKSLKNTINNKITDKDEQIYELQQNINKQEQYIQTNIINSSHNDSDNQKLRSDFEQYKNLKNKELDELKSELNLIIQDIDNIINNIIL